MPEELLEVESWSDIIPSVLKVPVKVYQHRHLIQKWWKHLGVATGKGHTNIVISGRSSVGKSCLRARLLGLSGSDHWDLPGKSLDVENGVVQVGKWSKTVRVIPGDAISDRYLGLDEAFSKHSSLDGVIHVVDYGFTPVIDTTVKKNLINEGGLDTIEKLRKRNLEVEIIDFKIVAARIQESFARCQRPKWLVVVVAKADLFINKIDDAQAYYHPLLGGDFGQEIDQLLYEIGKQNLRVKVVPVSAWDQDFEWNEDTVETKIGGSERSKALFRNFVSTLAGTEKPGA